MISTGIFRDTAFPVCLTISDRKSTKTSVNSVSGLMVLLLESQRTCNNFSD